MNDSWWWCFNRDHQSCGKVKQSKAKAHARLTLFYTTCFQGPKSQVSSLTICEFLAPTLLIVKVAHRPPPDLNQIFRLRVFRRPNSKLLFFHFHFFTDFFFLFLLSLTQVLGCSKVAATTCGWSSLTLTALM